MPDCRRHSHLAVDKRKSSKFLISSSGVPPSAWQRQRKMMSRWPRVLRLQDWVRHFCIRQVLGSRPGSDLFRACWVSSPTRKSVRLSLAEPTLFTPPNSHPHSPLSPPTTTPLPSGWGLYTNDYWCVRMRIEACQSLEFRNASVGGWRQRQGELALNNDHSRVILSYSHY